jgi:ParB-like chromosome segregation protein Spo0J
MKIALMDIGRVVPYARNPRRNEAAVAKVAASLTEFGWRQPIVVDGEMTIIAGHTRYLAAQRLGMKKVPVHVADNLTPEQARAYRLMDNRSHEASEWNLVLLPLELKELEAAGISLELAGFSDGDLEQMLGAAADEIPGGNKEIDEEALAETKKECPSCGFRW